MTDAMLKGVLFDMDDTLIDWRGFNGDWQSLEKKHLHGVHTFLSESGYALNADLDTFREIFANYAAAGWEEGRGSLRAPHVGRILMSSLAHCGFDPNNGISMEDCLEAYGWGIVPGVTVFPDVPSGLQTLLDEGIQIGIITNAFQPMSMRDIELEQYDLLRYFPRRETRVSAADFGYLKPHPDIFHHTLGHMGLKPEEVIYVGDNPAADVGGAHQAGMKAILRVNGTAPASSNLFVADAVITSLEEIPMLLQQWSPSF